MTTPWVHKYTPKSVKEVVGHAEVIARLKQYLAKYKPGQKPILLCGNSGIGKTALVHALAHDLDLELLEINASDHRNKDAIDTILGGAVTQQSLFFRPKLILVDEVDGVSGMQDRGGIGAIVALLPKAHYPIIFTATDKAEEKLKPLLKMCETITLADLVHEQLLSRLTHIAKQEQVKVEQEQLAAISRHAAHDLRAAINDLQSLAQGKEITKSDVAALDERERTQEVRQALLHIFKTTSAEVALPSFDNVDEDPQSLLLWMDENIPREYQTPADRARAFEALAEADRFFGRIRRWQYYRYYVYVYNLLTAGIALAKEKRYPGVTEYKPTMRILRIWMANQKNAKRKRIAQAIAPHLHTSTRRAFQDLPYLKLALKDKKHRETFCAMYQIDDETAEWLR